MLQMSPMLWLFILLSSFVIRTIKNCSLFKTIELKNKNKMNNGPWLQIYFHHFIQQHQLYFH